MEGLGTLAVLAVKLAALSHLHLHGNSPERYPRAMPRFGSIVSK